MPSFELSLFCPSAPSGLPPAGSLPAKGILVGQSYVAAQIWQAPPYNFSNAQVGMTNIPGVSGHLPDKKLYNLMLPFTDRRHNRRGLLLGLAK